VQLQRIIFGIYVAVITLGLIGAMVVGVTHR
jgi:hypothetical protein